MSASSRPARGDPILVADNVRRSYGGLVAVDVDHLEVERGVITALIGPNGAGKTTLFNLLTGFDSPDRGEFQFDGTPVRAAHPHQLAKLGMVRTFQLTKSLNRMTVLDNMKLAASDQRGEHFIYALFPGSWRTQERAIEQHALELLDRFGLARMTHEFAGSLSGGQRKLLEMARALMTQPKLLMLDEPTAGVNPALTQSLLDHIRGLPRHGLTVLFVEHDMDVVMSISDWVIVMAQGRIIAEGRPAAIVGNDAVIEAYLGRRHQATVEELEAEQT